MQFLFFKKWLGKVLDFFFPLQCRICYKEGEIICPYCLSMFTPAGRMTLDLGLDSLCCFEYGEGTSRLLKNLKYEGRAENASIIANFMIKFYKKDIMEADFLVPIPIHTFARIKRRYNVPSLICLYLSRKMKRQTLHVLKKKIFKSQVGLKREERIENAKNFFEISSFKKFKSKVEGKTILLIDDVLTTGATAMSAKEKLLELCPKEVKVITFAIKNLD